MTPLTIRFPRVLGALLLAACALTAQAHENFAEDPAATEFVAEMQRKHGFAREDLEALMADARVQKDVLDRMKRPAERLPWHRYRPIFLTEARIAGGVDFWRQHADTLARAEAEYGVAPEAIVAIIGVETAYGRYKGKLRVLDALATLAFGYPRRAKFFRGELEEFLLLTRDGRLPVRELRGSYAGAMGIPQFIPSSYRAYAVDFDGDGVRDLLGSVEDAIGSVANYLARHGWRRGEALVLPAQAPQDVAAPLLEKGSRPHTPLGSLFAAGVKPAAVMPAAGETDAALVSLETEQGEALWVVFRNFYAITRYNPSNLYGMAVTQLAEAIRTRRAAADAG